MDGDHQPNPRNKLYMIITFIATIVINVAVVCITMKFSNPDVPHYQFNTYLLILKNFRMPLHKFSIFFINITCYFVFAFRFLAKIKNDPDCEGIYNSLKTFVTLYIYIYFLDMAPSDIVCVGIWSPNAV